MTPEQQSELDRLIDRLSVGELDDMAEARLDELLANDLAVRRIYLERVYVIGSLHYRLGKVCPLDDERAHSRGLHGGAVAGATASGRAPVVGFLGRVTDAISRPVVWSVLAAGVLFAAYVVVISWNMLDKPLPSGTDGSGRAVAEIIGSEDAQWRDGESGTRDPRSEIRSGQPLAIESGLVELKLSQGATLLIEGPAEWTIDGANSATLKRGKLVAEVPAKAVGFAVETPTARVVDLGTEFGVEIDGQGATQVHVYRGAVSTSSTAGVGVTPVTRLVAGQSIKVDANGQSAPAIFVGREQIFKPSVVGSDPRKLLAFYPFDGDARDAGGNGFDATKVEQVEFVEGHERMAAKFSGELTSFIELPIDASADTVPDFTWGAWVRPAKPIERASEILSTDDMDYDRVLTVDNRIGPGGTSDFRFAAFGGPALGAIVVDRPRPRAGHWTFLAAVYRQATGTVALYVENPELRKGRGGLVSEIAGNAKIGPSYRFVRVGARVPTQLGHPGSFCGEIDNVFLFADALGHKELEAIRTGGAASILALATGNSERNTTNHVDQTRP